MQENVPELLMEAANLLLVGMSVVFIFLTLLIGAVQLIAYINSILPEEVVEAPSSKPPVRRQTANSDAVGGSTIAAISAAIHQYRQSR